MKSQEIVSYVNILIYNMVNTKTMQNVRYKILHKPNMLTVK